jgi:spoIIIJ-associated protein
MKKLAMKGKTVEEALENGVKILGLTRDQVEYRVISEGKQGIMGMFGGEEAEIEIREKVSPAVLGNEVLQDILNYMGLMAISEIKEENSDNVVLNVKGEDLGQIIGKDGATLNALQMIVSTIVSRDFAERKRIYVDAGGYREKRVEALSRMAKEIADEVVSTGREKVLPPMNAADRRIIHMSLSESDKVKTESRGEGAERRLVVSPK